MNKKLKVLPLDNDDDKKKVREPKSLLLQAARVLAPHLTKDLLPFLCKAVWEALQHYLDVDVQKELFNEFKEWRSDGTKLYFQSYKNGKFHGLREVWYENGSKRYSHTYQNGKLNGLARYWHNNGKIMVVENNTDGLKDGLQEEWYKSGAKMFARSYQNGELHGPFKAWHANDQKRSVGTYQNGAKDGLWRVWYENGQLRSTTIFFSGLAKRN